jgi:precorrin-2 dehydrogenase / sirohydrochlorin ferrochelatase
MIPIALDPGRITIALAGGGAPFRRRLDTLRAGSARQLTLFCDEPRHGFGDQPNASPEAIDRLVVHHRLPRPTDLAGLDVLWIAGLASNVAAPLATAARAHGVLVNVEDQPDLCDFHSVAEIRRGDLLLTVSTGGRSPGLAARIRARLERQFSPAWATRVARIASLRQQWREDGSSMAEVAAHTDAVLKSAGWLT